MERNHQRDERILAHIGLYRLTFRRVLSVLFFDGRTAGNIVQRLCAEGRIQARGGLPQRLFYYQLTLAEASRRGLPVARSRPPKPQAFHAHLAILWHCCMSPAHRQRRRLERHELEKLFGNRVPGGPHLIEAGPTPRVFRVQVVGPGTPARSAVRALRRRVEYVRRRPELRAWVHNRQYAFLLLTDTPGRCARIAEIAKRHAIPSRAQVEFAHVPDYRAAGAALRAAKPRPRAP
ncbi:MAG: hypothetical protein WC718_02065 [Phycisphaerales bacterium]|jgi:hypothetical protein